MAEAAGAASRAAAVRAIVAVIDGGRRLELALAAAVPRLAPTDAAFARMLAFGVLRDYRGLTARTAPRLKKPASPTLAALLAVGVFQLEHTRVPPHAAIHATVAAADALGLGKARGALNAVLRRHQRDPLPAPSPESPALCYSYPDWLVAAIQRDWPRHWPAVLAGGNERAPMWLRVNARRTRVAAFRARLEATGRGARTYPLCPDALSLAKAEAADTLPGFAEGAVSVQDAAAQIAADCLDARNGQRVLDACCAPGNKSAHLLERANIDLLGLDHDDARLTDARANLARLGLAADLQVADAADAARAWWDGLAFDRILLDAPCSGTGVIRRHPDIKWLRRAADVERATTIQRAMLAVLWPTLAPGGRLVYAVCSVLAAEGSAVIEDFVANTADARTVAPHGDWGEAVPGGRRIAPSADGLDGFYYAILERASSPGGL